METFDVEFRFIRLDNWSDFFTVKLELLTSEVEVFTVVVVGMDGDVYITVDEVVEMDVEVSEGMTLVFGLIKIASLLFLDIIFSIFLLVSIFFVDELDIKIP